MYFSTQLTQNNYTIMKQFFYTVFALFSSITVLAQTQTTTINGTVNEANTDSPLPGANIKVSGKAVGTNTDLNGKFTLSTDNPLPFTIEISSLGYTTKKVEITQNNQVVSVALQENQTALGEIVISASRAPERIMESPVTIERMDIRAIRNSSSPSFYDALENLKGVDINTSSLTFKSVNTRGFATFGNPRFMQLVDGMDNTSPALNFAIGNLLGIPEVDVQTVELLPGASSALYGANAFNGILLMTSKNPFDNQGVDVSLKTGLTSQEVAGSNQFYDLGLRMAYAYNNTLAIKGTVSFLDGTEWFANDDRNIKDGKYIAGDRSTDLNYNGVNVYGDEASTNLRGVAETLEKTINPDTGKPFMPAGASALIPNVNVSRTGYNEADLMNYEARNLKFSGSVHYRPFQNEDLEIIWQSKLGTGNTIYQGANRYNIKNFSLQQHKLELKGKNFFVRGYQTSEDAGDSYDALFTGLNILNKWKSHETWFGEYAGAYLKATLDGALSEQAHKTARTTANKGMPQAGSSEFKKLFDEVTSEADVTKGSKFVDNTKLYHMDANFNFSDYIDWAEIQVGGSFRQYALNSGGTIFTDADGVIDYNEYGAYTQLQKKFLPEDRLKLTASVRYDKSQNFDGNVSPRVSLAYAAGEDKNHNFRASFQTGFRNPTTQDQYIGLDVGKASLVGAAPDNLDRYKITKDGVTYTGRDAYENSITRSSLEKFGAKVATDVATGMNPQLAAGKNASLLEKAEVNLVKPEQVNAFEVGYRGILNLSDNTISIDANLYYNDYKDFIANRTVIALGSGDINKFDPKALTDPNTQAILKTIGDEVYRPFQTYTNSTAEISSYGATVGLSTAFSGFNVGLNYTYAKFDFDQTTDPDFEAGFNTPEHKLKFQFGKSDLFKNFGFNINVRWQDEYYWESTFVDATIDARTILDAQINYRIPQWKSIIKLGGSNLTGNEYFSAPGVGAIGSQYFLSWTIDN